MLLLVSEEKELTVRLLRNGFFCLRCHSDATLACFDRYEISGICIDGRVDYAKTATLCANLREKESRVPILFLINGCEIPLPLGADYACRETDVSAVTKEIEYFCQTACGWKPLLQMHDLSVSTSPKETRYLGYPLPLSPMGHRILRFLFYRAPHEVSREEILAVCFPEGTQKEANLAVQISGINKAAEKIYATAPLICNYHKKGYVLSPRILSPEEEKPLLCK